MSLGAKNMKLVTTYWGNDKTFKLMPIKEGCPFMEVIYDPNTDMLVAISKDQKQNLQMVPKLDDDGNYIQAKKPKKNGKPFKEKQIQMLVPQEFYMIDREEMKQFIEEFAVNAEDYDYDAMFKDLSKAIEENKVITPTTESAPLLDSNGMPIQSKTPPKKAPAKKASAKKPAAKKEEPAKAE